MERNFILFTTDLFIHEQSNADIDRWFVGGDCCGWFYMRLLLQEQIDPCLPPVMEDWGWTFAVIAHGIPVTVNTWPYHEFPKCWLMGLHARKRRIFRYPEEERTRARDLVADGIISIVQNDDRFTRYHWTIDNPFDTGVTEFPP